MLLDKMAAFTGGIIKDTVVGISDSFDWIVEEVSAIPDAFSAGYEHGIMSAPDESDLDHHVDIPEETIAEKHGHKFGSKTT
jgi:hypothetical protein